MGSPILDFIKNNLVTGSVALMDFITYLVTKIIFIKSNIVGPVIFRDRGKVAELPT